MFSKWCRDIVFVYGLNRMLEGAEALDAYDNNSSLPDIWVNPAGQHESLVVTPFDP